MKVLAKKRFFSDLSKIKSIEVLDNAEFIYDIANIAENCNDIPGFKYLRYHKNVGRIEIAPYRIGVKIEGKTITFVCVIHRSAFYKQFP